MDRKDACRILGVSEDADKVEITRRYEILLKRNKAARVEGEEQQGGASPEEIDMAYKLLMGYDTSDMVEDYELKESKILKKAGISEKKLRNFFYYHKFHILIGILVALFVGYMITDIVTKPEPDLFLAFVGDFYFSDSEAIEKKITQDIPDIKHPMVESVLTGMATGYVTEYNPDMKLTAILGAKDVEVFILDRPTYERLGQQGFLANLDDFIDKYAIDMEVNRENLLKARNDTGEHLYGIDVTKHEFFENPAVLGEKKIVAIAVWAKENPNAIKFVEYLVKKD